MISKYSESKFRTEKSRNSLPPNHDFICFAKMLSGSFVPMIKSEELTFFMEDFFKIRILGEIDVFIASGTFG